MSFKLLHAETLEDIQSQGRLYQHEGTGAQVLVLENDDSNKSFTIGFKTLPYSDNGITHIIEHSVLNGSQKYPVKEPFVEIIKGSLSTFINAITYADKTIYPVASTNSQDFLNLMGVYLDAVFAPKMVENPMILAQEGWHYHLEAPEDDLTLKGVVYNEMKGANASPDSQLYNHLKAGLYPGTPYAWNSGGDSQAIPEISQEDFINYYQDHYHPSNSLSVIYGDGDEAAALDLLEEYFSRYNRVKAPSEDLAYSLPETSLIQETYSLNPEEDPAGKDYLALAWHATEAGDLEAAVGLSILAEILLGNAHAPLKKVLLDADLGGDISGDYMTVGHPGMFTLEVKYGDAGKLDTFKDRVQTTLTQLVEEGIDPDLIQAALNRSRFSTQEMMISQGSPRGILYTLTAYKTWLYGGSPFEPLQMLAVLDAIQAKAQEGYFEGLIQEKLLDNPHRVAVVMTGEPGKAQARDQQVHQDLQAYKASLSPEEVQDLVTKTQELIASQQAPNDPRDLATIPSLDKEDLEVTVDLEPIQQTQLEGGQPWFSYEDYTAGIHYVDWFIRLDDQSADSMTDWGLFAQLLGNLPTEAYSLQDLKKAIDTYTGGISASLTVYTDAQGQAKPCLVLKGKASQENGQKLVDLMAEILFRTDFSDSKEVYTYIHELIADFEQVIDYNSNALASLRASSQHFAAARLQEGYQGIDFFQALKAWRDRYQAQEDLGLDWSRQLDRVTEVNRYRFLYTGEAQGQDQVKTAFQDLVAPLKVQDMGPIQDYQPAPKVKEAFLSNQDVNYVALATDASPWLDYSGTSRVIANILSFDYLWQAVRVQGGAYGSGFRHGYSGQVSLYSYRDPYIVKTWETFLKVPDFIRDLDMTPEALLKTMIGCISQLDQPKSPHQKGEQALALYLQGRSPEDIARLKEEILATDLEAIQAAAPGYQEALEAASLVVIGNSQMIQEAKDYFDAIHSLF